MLRLKEVREKLRLSQNDVSRITDIAQPTLSKWERGVTVPKIQTVFRLADALGVTVDELWTNDPPEEEELLQESDGDMHVALHLPDGMSYDDISDEGKLELQKYLLYLRHAYPARPENGEED